MDEALIEALRALIGSTRALLEAKLFLVQVQIAGQDFAISAHKEDIESQGRRIADLELRVNELERNER